jgi:hypothetical protein
MIQNINVSKTTILSGFQYLYTYLATKAVTNNICQYKDKIFITERVYTYVNKDKQYIQDHDMRIWKSDSILDIWYDNLSGDNFLGGINYSINPDYVKIDYINVNDEENYEKKSSYRYDNILRYEDFLNEDNAKIFRGHLLRYVETIAWQHNKPKLILDLHCNLRLYNKFYKPYGFIETGRKCHDNPYWVEVEKEVVPPHGFEVMER